MNRVRRYLALWLRLLRLCLRVERRATVTALALRAAGLVTLPATGLALRAAIDASSGGVMTAAVLAAAGAAVIQVVDVAVDHLGAGLRIFVVDRTGLLELDPELLRDVGGVEGLDHLERPDYLDRITVLHGASWGVMHSAWLALDSAFGMVRLVIVLALLGTVSPYLLLLLVVAVVPLWFDLRGARQVAAVETATAETMRVQRHLFDLLTTAASSKEITVTGSGRELSSRQARAWREVQEARHRAQVLNALWRAGGWAVFTAGFAVALGFVVLRAARGAGSLGDVVLAVTVATSLRDAVQDTVRRSAEAGATRRLIDPYLWLRDYVREQARADAARRPTPGVLRDGIRLERVSYRYPGTVRDAVAEVDVHLPAGAVVAVVGEFGSGKSTLVKLLCRFHRPTGGAIRIDGHDLADLDTPSWWARTAVAFQDFGRYRATLREAVGLGDLDRIDDGERVAAALAAADGQGLVGRLPDGLESELGREFDGAELSEGQWQKVALARACMREEPLLFVLDEPTASLDAPSERAIFDHYRERARVLSGRTGAVTVIISHRFSTVAGADLILVMDGGRLVESGSHAELVAAGGRYADLYGITSRAYAPVGGDPGTP